MARLRQGLYRWFGAAFLPPEHERWSGLFAATTVLRSPVIQRFPFAGPWHALLATLDEGPSLAEIGVEHTRLFGQGPRRGLCSPVESDYHRCSTEVLVAVQRSVRREYRLAGLAPVGSARAPDHVTTELELMSVLCGREADAWRTNAPNGLEGALGAEQRFLGRHLGRWLPLLTYRLTQEARLDYHRALAAAVEAFLVCDRDLVDLLVGETAEEEAG